MIKEKHENLRGGDGFVTTYTTVIFLKGKKVKLIIIKMYPRSSIGLHQHVDDSEVYFTLNRHVRFGLNRKKFYNYCPKEGTHSANNLSDKLATVFAIKF